MSPSFAMAELVCGAPAFSAGCERRQNGTISTCVIRAQSPLFIFKDPSLENAGIEKIGYTISEFKRRDEPVIFRPSSSCGEIRLGPKGASWTRDA